MYTSGHGYNHWLHATNMMAGKAKSHAICVAFWNLVDPNGLEPSTSAMSRQRSNQLSYGSICSWTTRELRILAQCPWLRNPERKKSGRHLPRSPRYNKDTFSSGFFMLPFANISQHIEHITHSLAEQGYVIIPAFLPDDFISALRNEALTLQAAGKLKRATIGKAEHNTLDHKIRGDLIHWLDHVDASVVQQDFSRIMEALRESLNEHLFLGLFELENHFAIYPPGAIYNKHLDQFRGNEERQVSCILYLNEAWEEKDGGQLRLYLDGKNPTPYIDTVPHGGTLVVFLSSQFWHEVLPASQPRISLTGWFRKRSTTLP